MSRRCIAPLCLCRQNLYSLSNFVLSLACTPSRAVPPFFVGELNRVCSTPSDICNRNYPAKKGFQGQGRRKERKESCCFTVRRGNLNRFACLFCGRLAERGEDLVMLLPCLRGIRRRARFVVTVVVVGVVG